MKIKESRLASFLIVLAVYILAVGAGVGTFLLLDVSLWLDLLIADVVATIITYIFSLVFKNASVYDPYWSVQPIVIVIAFAIGQVMNPVKIITIVVVCFWGVRLTVNWGYTFSNLNHQDWRYTMIEEKTGFFYPLINFLGIHLVPTIIVYACVLPAVYVITSNAVLNAWSIIFLGVSLLAVILQGTADIQMHKFRENRAGKKFIRNGLWKYSRHPNYLGEILMWWGIAFSAVVALNGAWYLLFGALLNTMLFIFVSIPMADKRQAKKEGFEEYKKETRALLPIKKIHKNKETK